MMLMIPPKLERIVVDTCDRNALSNLRSPKALKAVGNDVRDMYDDMPIARPSHDGPDTIVRGFQPSLIHYRVRFQVPPYECGIRHSS